MSNIKNYISLITGFFETLCAGAIIYGWSSLNYVLIKEGYFNSSCNNSLHVSTNSSDFICPKQRYELGLVFTLAAAIPPGLCIFVGKFLDYYGTWALRTVNSILFTASCVAIAFSSSYTSWILYPATIIINLCGYVILITNTQIANLFPHYRGLVTNVINGALNASLIIFTLVKIAYEDGYSLKFSFLLLALLGPYMLIRTFLFMPKSIIPFHLPQNYYYGIKEFFSSKNINLSEETSLFETTSSRDENESNTFRLNSYVFNLLYVFGVYAFSIQILRMNFFVEALNVKLIVLFSANVSAVVYNLSVFGYLQLISLIFAPLIGVLYDILQGKFEKLSYTKLQAQMKALALENLLASVVLISYTLLSIFWFNPLQYFSYVLYVFSENLAYSNLGVFLLHCFPMKHFGTLYGLALLLSAIVTTLQFPLYFAVIHYFHNHFLVVDIILLILTILTLVHPIDLYLRSKRC